MNNKIEIGKQSKVLIKWETSPLDYSKDKENQLIDEMSIKYDIPKGNIKIEPILKSKDLNNSSDINFNGTVENINDPKFQQNLFKKYIEINKIKDYEFDKILEIDDIVNAHINYDIYESHKRYTFKWIKWSNFMSYGKDNYFDFNNLNGLVLLTSEPANQGGKTTFCLDLFKFLLFGKVTSRDNDWTLAKVFNRHIPEATDVVVEACLVIDGTEYVIKRVVTRPKLEKRTNKSKCSQKVYYYKITDGEYINLEDNENENASNGRATNKLIKDAIGNESDFDLMICVSSDNLKQLISLKDTERGKLVSRWIGLLPLEEKDKIAREIYNQDIVPKLLSNKFNKNDIEEKIKQLNIENDELKSLKKKSEEEEKNTLQQIDDENKNRDALLSSIVQIDNTLSKLDVNTLNTKLEKIKNDGIQKRKENEENKLRYKQYENINFNEEDFKQVDKECIRLNIDIASKREQLVSLKKEVENLKKGEYCPTCGAKLKDVDNSALISKKQKDINNLINEGKKTAELLKNIENKKAHLEKERISYNEKIRLQLIIEKIEVDIENLLSSYKETKRKIDDIEKNKSAIENNNKINIALNNINAKIKSYETSLKLIRNNIMNYSSSIVYNDKEIIESNKIIDVINQEIITIRNWKIYLDMIGKRGICKLVIRDALPLINGELSRLLNGVCDFTVEVAIDDRNDVEFYLIHDGVKSNLSSGSGFEQTVSSIALRSVLSKISTFSKPSFVVFDEILGGVADENYDQVKLLYDKIVKDYSLILQISHLKQIYDWHNKFITIKKENNISKIEIF